MALGDSRDLGGPQLRYSRLDPAQPQAPVDDALAKALELARSIEELLEDTRSVSGPVDERLHASTHSTRMARAMAASLVDELEVLVRPARTSGVA
jgi:hypothetical protein